MVVTVFFFLRDDLDHESLIEIDDYISKETHKRLGWNEES